MAAVERLGWWDWRKPPRSEADVHQLPTLRDAASRLRLIRRRGRRLHATTRGVELLATPERLWQAVATVSSTRRPGSGVDRSPACERRLDENLCHPREKVDCLVRRQVSHVGGPDNRIGSEQRDQRIREPIPGISRNIARQAFEESRDPVAAVRQSSARLYVFRAWIKREVEHHV
jgi:hypothetical protein